MKKTNLKAIIVDDEPKASNYLLQLLKELQLVDVVEVFNAPEIALEQIPLSHPEILFLDVQMPGMNGFELLRSVRSKDYQPLAVFTTAFEKYAIQAIKNAAFDYLLKPVNKEELKNCLEKIESEVEQENVDEKLNVLIEKLNTSRKIKFNNSTGFIVIDESEIVYCQADRNYCEIHLSNNRREVVTCNMNQVHQRLSGKQFFRISRFHLINTDYLVKVERRGQLCTLKDDQESVQLKMSSKGMKALEEMHS